MKKEFSDRSASLAELKKNAGALIAQGEPIAILNRDVPEAYLVPAETYEYLIELLEDMEWV